MVMARRGFNRIQRRDRPWPDLYVTVLCGPFEMPTADALRHAVAAIAGRYPDSRLTWRLDPTKRFWVNDRSPESVVAESNWDGSLDIGARLDAMALDDTLDPPLTLIRYPSHIGLKMSHSVGDGRLFLSVIASVLQTALTGDVVQWPAQRAGRFPLTTAAIRTLGRRPALLRAAIKDRHPHGEAPSAPAPARPWAPSQRTLHRTISRARADEIYDWGRQFAPGASRFALQVSLLLRAMDKVGIDISPDVRVVVDLRRYLGWRYIDGNFITSTSMNIAAHQSPTVTSAIVKATNRSARPLVAQIAAQTQAALMGGVQAEVATTVDPGARPRLTFSSLGLSPEIDQLPFQTDTPTIYAGSVPSEGPTGMTFLVAETSTVLSINAIFHDNVIDADLVAEALQMVVDDPLDLFS